MKNIVNYLDDYIENSIDEAIKRNRPKTAIKAMKKSNRDAEYETKVPGWHSTHSIHPSKKTYNRNNKYKEKY